MTERSMTDAIRMEQVAEIVSAYVSNNAVSPTDLPALIASTHSAMRSLSSASAEPQTEELKPAVPIKKSVTPDFIICLDDGKKFKSMKRHLAGLGMTPDQYRAKWGLPKDYPMVAPDYAATRSALAKSNGLGRKASVKPVVPARKKRSPSKANN
ncbi:MAG: MucR family transcriptional regulator [Alphaproteobacteria bacterium]|nr:MucR family transcriptional regulator [Alphaproteobacteria bacterium]MBU1560706.1 MucR family transcriptional regulator [Alphaproteobacteria bacterium]MBU2301910.1 MucR family transcriptional regulator [Alphaproteobacteria bacterium]MBU2368960.1 MucR family transcriptional regulator [Alphaproteobacteria bacterium]